MAKNLTIFHQAKILKSPRTIIENHLFLKEFQGFSPNLLIKGLIVNMKYVSSYNIMILIFIYAKYRFTFTSSAYIFNEKENLVRVLVPLKTTWFDT